MMGQYQQQPLYPYGHMGMNEDFNIPATMGGSGAGARIDPNMIQNTGFYGTNLASLGGMPFNQHYANGAQWGPQNGDTYTSTNQGHYNQSL